MADHLGESAAAQALGPIEHAIAVIHAVQALLVLLTGLLLPGSALAGGGVMLENDTCIITVGFYRAHFTAYQPQTRGDEEFCEDLPDVGEAVFVLDYLHDSMKQVPVDFRIIRDATGLGNFTRLEDVRALGDLAPLTVFYRPPSVEPDASYRVRHEFAAPGHFVGIVTAISDALGSFLDANDASKQCTEYRAV